MRNDLEKVIDSSRESAGLNIRSEIGSLKKVILHRPGKEIEHIIPDNMERLLFDDIPFLPTMQKEHDFFAKELTNQGAEVLYLEDLVVESVQSPADREQFIDAYLAESCYQEDSSYGVIKEYLQSLSAEELVRKMMEGVLKKELGNEQKEQLNELITTSNPFYLDPMPNLYFTRDPAAVIGKGISIHTMNKGARKRESMFVDIIMKRHPLFKNQPSQKWLKRTSPFPIEGGDILILNNETVAIGVSERTTAQAIEQLARQLLNGDDGFRQVVAVEIPKKRAFMHLDTVFTMIDKNLFTVHPEIHGENGEMAIYILSLTKDGEVSISKRTHLLETLKEVLGLTEISLIPCGGGDEIHSPREQWNDGSNTLAIAPGVVITYDRNYVTNQLLRESGVKVIEIPSSELSRGRGGPRCMSMPIVREDF